MSAVAYWDHDTVAASSDQTPRTPDDRTEAKATRRVRNAVTSLSQGLFGIDNTDTMAVREGSSLADLTGRAIFDQVIRPDIRKLAELAQLSPGWDSYEAEALTPEALATASLLLAAVATKCQSRLGSRVRPYVIVPVADGGVQVEWRTPSGIIEVEIGPDEALSYLLLRDGREAIERDSVVIAEVQRAVIDLLRG